MVEIKETVEERINRKSNAADEKRNINNGLVGVLRRDSDPMADPPRTKFFRRKNSDGDKMKKVGLRNNRHVITCERQLTVGSMGGIIAAAEFWLFRLGAISISLAN